MFTFPPINYYIVYHMAAILNFGSEQNKRIFSPEYRNIRCHCSHDLTYDIWIYNLTYASNAWLSPLQL